MRTGFLVTATQVAVFLAAIIAANLLVTANPQWAPINAFLFIGLDLTTRDLLDDRWRSHRPLKLGALVIAGAAIAYLINDDAHTIALASAVAFAGAFTADAIVYSMVREQPWLTRANVSNWAGAGVDSILFPLLAFPAIPGAFLGLDWFLVGTLFGMKLGGGAWWAWVVMQWREHQAGKVLASLPHTFPIAPR